MVVATKFCLLQQKYFVATKPLSRQIFLATNIILSRQTRVCRYKTRLLSRQKYACHVKTFVATNTCFVTTSILLSRQKTCFVMTKTSLSQQTTKHLSRHKLYLWQLLPMIVAMPNLPVQGSTVGYYGRRKIKFHLFFSLMNLVWSSHELHERCRYISKDLLFTIIIISPVYVYWPFVILKYRKEGSARHILCLAEIVAVKNKSLILFGWESKTTHNHPWCLS